MTTLNPNFVMLYGSGGDTVTISLKYCPKLKDCEFEPGMVEFEYFDTSRVYLGSPTYKFTWDFMDVDDAKKIWDAYKQQIKDAKPIQITIPDPDGGWYLTYAYITMPEGEYSNDPIENFSFIAYNVHEDTAIAGCKTWLSTIWTDINNGMTYEVGSSTEVRGTGWIF